MADKAETIEQQKAKAIDTFLKSDLNFQGAGFGSQAINAGFIGKVEKIDLVEVKGTGISKRSQPQIMNLVTGALQVADKDEYSQALSLVFEGGARTLTINTLVAHPDSFITNADATTTNFVAMTGKQWASLVGKTIECVDAVNDEDRKIPRVKRFGAEGETEMRATRKYEFKVNA